jgi:adenosylcobinamide-GDP ribazoletransferase
MVEQQREKSKQSGSLLATAIAFYTCLPIPSAWLSDFRLVSRLAPVVGLVIGGILSGLDTGLRYSGVPELTQSAVVTITWVAITGGLHLDGVMDTADGLAVQDPERRLAVMADSATGAFGAMAAIAILLLKTAALSDLPHHRWLFLLLSAGWGRWAQQIAIVRYPYLKPTGKGAFHKAALRPWQDLLPNLLLLLGICSLPMLLSQLWGMSLTCLAGGAIALLVPAWFHHKLGGHTGDTYGATVEWTEALFLVLMTASR